jgi:hypothetical protein
MKAKTLIIGNANYPNSILDNPENDAIDIANTLTRLGFETSVILNADKVTQDKSITDFATSLDEYDIGIFYFAGHGFQIDNENYLAAIDTIFDDEAHAKHTAFPLNILLSYLNKAKNQTSIIILDACRELLNKKAWYRSVESAGLAPIFAPKGTLIAFATSPGEKALDGTGKRNGVYTSALLQHIIAENIPIEEMFKRVRNTVFALSKGKQTSWEHTSLTGTFCFNSGQLSHSLTIEYSSDVIKDSLYEINTKTLADSIVKDLKSYNYYIQNPAIEKLHLIDASTEDINKLFLIGRNILQTACGGSSAAISIMEDLPAEISRFMTGNKNHILNGIVYETFFNSFGSFRQDEIKDKYLDIIYKTLEHKEYEESLKFLTTILMPFNDVIFYIPTVSFIGLAFDLEFDKTDTGIILKSIRHEGNEVLIKQESSDYWGMPNEITYRKLQFQYLKKYIGKNIFTPEKLITLSSNMDLTDEQIILFPDNYKIMK